MVDRPSDSDRYSIRVGLGRIFDLAFRVNLLGASLQLKLQPRVLRLQRCRTPPAIISSLGHNEADNFRIPNIVLLVLSREQEDSLSLTV